MPETKDIIGSFRNIYDDYDACVLSSSTSSASYLSTEKEKSLSSYDDIDIHHHVPSFHCFLPKSFLSLVILPERKIY